MNKILKKTIQEVIGFYDQNKVGDIGPFGFRRSTDLAKLSNCIDWLIDQGLLFPDKSLFLDMGCADGRVNVLLSYFTRKSIGIEIDEWTLDEYAPLKERLKSVLTRHGLIFPPHNIHLFLGDVLDENIYKLILERTNLTFNDFDFFYTYLTMYEELAELIYRNGKKGSIFLIYGLEKIIPHLRGFDILTSESPLENILAVYQKN